MAAGYLPITIEKGATFRLRYLVKSGGATTARPLTVEEALALPPFDLTGFGATAQVRESPTSTAILATCTCTIGEDPTTGEIVIVIDFEITALMPSGVMHWDCFITSEATGPIRLLAGPATVQETVTRP